MKLDPDPRKNSKIPVRFVATSDTNWAITATVFIRVYYWHSVLWISNTTDICWINTQARRQWAGRGAMSPDFRFCPPDFFLAPPRYFFGRKKLVFLGVKNVKICNFGQKKPSDFGESLFFWRSPAFSRKICDFGQKNSLDSGEDLFFFIYWRSPAFGRKICDFGQKNPSDFGEDLCPPDFNFAPPPPITRSWRRPC